jgi:hypothetical protein
VIDGQQRLTTLQIFLAAFRDFCRENDCEELARECETFTANRGMMPDPAVEKFKVSPTNLDRDQFMDVVSSGSRTELEKRHPLVRRKYARQPDRRPLMVEAYLFFRDQLEEFFLGSEAEPPFAAEAPMASRLEECFQTLKNSLQVVVIDLDKEDDAQVIFETLNSRGEPLLPADLLRNYIFLRAARQGAPSEALYETYWTPFDEAFWRVVVKQGRLLRPRGDIFMQHFLASRQTVDIPIAHLYVEYKFWIERKRPFASIEEELATLARQGADFRRIIEPRQGDDLHSLATFLDAFDMRTVYPLLLALLDADLDAAQWTEVSTTLESYLLRRAVCGYTTKNYNRIFLSLTRSLRRDGMSAENVAQRLATQSGESVEWPTDAAFSEAWRTQHAYRMLDNAKIVYILRRLNETYYGGKTEAVAIQHPLTVEHILPQSWIENWPLSDGTKGMCYYELIDADEDDPRAIATRERNALLQTFGNLTILTFALNSSVSNSPWLA